MPPTARAEEENIAAGSDDHQITWQMCACVTRAHLDHDHTVTLLEGGIQLHDVGVAQLGMHIHLQASTRQRGVKLNIETRCTS